MRVDRDDGPKFDFRDFAEEEIQFPAPIVAARTTPQLTSLPRWSRLLSFKFRLFVPFLGLLFLTEKIVCSEMKEIY